MNELSSDRIDSLFSILDLTRRLGFDEPSEGCSKLRAGLQSKLNEIISVKQRNGRNDRVVIAKIGVQ
jgi:hypothetical protein